MPFKTFCLMAFLALLLSGCHRRPSFRLIPQQTIVLHDAPETGFHKFGFVQDGGGRGYYYFGDPSTRKTVFFYDERGRLADTVRFPKLMANDDHVNFLVARSKDTLITTSAHDNYMYVFGKGGRLYSVADFEPLLYGGHNYTIAGPGSADFGRDVAYTAVWLDATQMRYPDTMTGEQQLRLYYTLAHSGPLIGRITQLTSGRPQISLMLAGAADRQQLEGFMGGTSTLFAASDNALFYHFPESDTLYKFNNITGRLEEYTNIRADHARITIEKVPYGGNNQGMYDRSINEQGMIRYIDYDPYRRLLYLRYYHEAAAGAPQEKKGDHRPWSLLVYDEHLHKVGEVSFAADTYNPMCLIATPKGLVLEKTGAHARREKILQLFGLVMPADPL